VIDQLANEPAKTLVVGYGLGGAAFHAPFIATSPRLALEGIVTRDPERRAAVRERYPGVRVHDSAEAAFGSGDYDLAVISTSNRSHVPLARAALQAGLHVVVDKPLAGSAAEVNELAELAARHRRLLTAYQNRRWDGDFRTVRELIADDRLGTVTRFESRIDRWRPTVTTTWRDSVDPADLGGLLYDLGSHLVDQALCLFGRPLSVYAELDRRRPGARNIDDGFIALTYPGGLRAHLWFSAVAATPGPRFRVLGSRASFTKYGVDPQEAALRAGRTPDERDWGSEPAENWGTLAFGHAEERVPTLPGCYEDYYGRVASAIFDEGQPPVEPRETATVMSIIETAQRAAATGAILAPPAEF
jgi:predicted dehydrogenase